MMSLMMMMMMPFETTGNLQMPRNARFDRKKRYTILKFDDKVSDRDQTRKLEDPGQFGLGGHRCGT